MNIRSTGLDADVAWHDALEPWQLVGDAAGEDAPETAATPVDACDELEDLDARMRLLVADRYRSIAEIVREAATDPDPWVGPDPTLDAAWADPRGRTVSRFRRDRRDLAVRAAVADIAVRLRLSENTVRSMADAANTLRDRCPLVWRGFLGGVIGERNARLAADAAASLPVDAATAWNAFDAQVVRSAAVLTPAKFRVRARAVRERVHRESLDERHSRAAEERGVWVVPEFDGMATLTALLPAAVAHGILNRLDAAARSLRGHDGESRTLAQLRADAFADLLLAGVGTDAAPAATVAITIPAMTLLGREDESATLDGYGPIDLDTAKQLAGGARSWIRVLTHPVSGTVLDLDRTTYRVPAALRRWLGVRDPVCTFPGCRRAAAGCEMDHEIEWALGGTTNSDDLDPKCGHHHHLRHDSEWAAHRDPDTGRLLWTSPTGHVCEEDPPPW